MTITIASTTVIPPVGAALGAQYTTATSVNRAASQGLLVEVLYGFEWGTTNAVTGLIWDAEGDNQAFELVRDIAGTASLRFAMFWLRNPTSVKSAPLRFTFAGASNDGINVRVSHTVGHDSSVASMGSSSTIFATPLDTDLTLTIPSATDEVVYFSAYYRDNPTYISNGSTLDNYRLDVISAGALSYFRGTKPGAASVTGTFLIGSGAGTYHNAMIAVRLKVGVVPPGLTLPTATVTGATTATVGVTTDTAPTVGTPLNVLVLPAASVVPSAATINAGPTQSITTGEAGARTFPLTGLTTGAAVRAHYAHGVTVLSTGNFTPVASVNLSAPTRSTPTSTTAVIGFTTDNAGGTARAVLIDSTTVPTTPSVAQVKAGQNAAGSTTSVVVPAALTITSIGIKTFAAATVGAGLTEYGFIVHTTAGGEDSAVLATGPLYPGTGRAVSDITAAWTVTGAATRAAAINEDTSNRSTFITGPAVSGTPSLETFALDKPYTPGTYSWSVDADIVGGSGKLRIKFFNDAGTLLGTSADQTLTTTATVFTFNMTVAGGTATQFGIETEA